MKTANKWTLEEITADISAASVELQFPVLKPQQKQAIVEEFAQ